MGSLSGSLSFVRAANRPLIGGKYDSGIRPRTRRKTHDHIKTTGRDAATLSNRVAIEPKSHAERRAEIIEIGQEFVNYPLRLRAIREARRTLWQLLSDPVTAPTTHLVRSRPRSPGCHAPGTLKGPHGVLLCLESSESIVELLSRCITLLAVFLTSSSVYHESLCLFLIQVQRTACYTLDKEGA